ncbi:hypothetical protein [Cellulomonas sp. KRMCY2]|uniref:hypothetical protein n=1 Tax=Cellulomonas sp. KRMCY2 TaxID=1304865 RepID=UPI00045EC039|nr:hypothetical protein [Cellulomonas sp. KRMCY2]
MDDATAGDLRSHYDGADTSAELERAELDTTAVAEPMAGITIRLSAATLDAARVLASERGLRVTALLREWIEERVAEQADDTRVVPVAALKRLIAKSRFPATFGPEVEVEEVDLDTTTVTVRGERLTEERAEAIARDVLARSEDS